MARLSGKYLIAVKRLSAVEADPARSNQHEFNGVGALRRVLGSERRERQPSTWVILNDDGQHLVEEHLVTWYDGRENQPLRSAEWRLYYVGQTAARPNDLLAIIQDEDRQRLGAVVAPAGTTWAEQLTRIFDVPNDAGTFRALEMDQVPELFLGVIRELFEALGWVEDPEPEQGEIDLAEAIATFGRQFPSTLTFSGFVQNRIQADPADPDATIVKWWQAEERLFRELEHILVEERLASGFANVEDFISYSLSVQNRRKSRAGHAFEHHLRAIFRLAGLTFASQERTEGDRTPDFLFPGIAEYRDAQFNAERLTMLGAKTTCKDRWRQILNEAARVPWKHLCTLEPAISRSQLDEMNEERLTLVAPAEILGTYPARAGEVLSVADFISLVRSRQTP